MVKYCLLLVALLSSPVVVFAQKIPGRYIVELSTEPVAEHMARSGDTAGMQSLRAGQQRTRVINEQGRLRSWIESGNTRVLGSVNTVANAIFVEASEAEAQRLATLPGVKRVLPSRQVKLLLDRAALVHKVDAVWNEIGETNGGAGIKVAIIDTGIQNTHPAFQSTSLAVPDGYPKTGTNLDTSFTNNKIIVARSYVDLLQARDPDLSPQDHVGHGTALGMTVAGIRTDAPLASISGMAPAAFLGNYKVFGTPGWNDYSSDTAIIKAIDDAVSDGMDIISLSIGSDLAPRLADDLEVQAVERATQAGVIVVVAAGNNGADLNTISSPATAPSAIAVGATSNQRTFGTSLEVPDLSTFPALPGNGFQPSTPITGTLRDVASTDNDGQACSALQSGSLEGTIALILRGNCTFETKLNNAQNAGAIGAVVYAAADSPSPIYMSVGAASLPAEMISNGDGVTIKKSLADGATLTGTLHFTVGPIPTPAGRLADFSAAGPGVDLSIKPDVVAVGQDFYTATQTYDPSGDMYDSSGFILVDGTSFSTPLVAGAAALIKSARPGLTVDQYRSLIINTASDAQTMTGGVTGVQQAGAGLLNALSALHAPATVSPVSLSLGAGGTDINVAQSLMVSNVSGQADTFTISAISDDASILPAIASSTVDIAAGAWVQVPLQWSATGLSAGPHQGFISITSSSGTSIRVPFWYAVASTPAKVTILDTYTSARRGSFLSDAILFRITDPSGVALTGVQPDVTVTAGGGAINQVVSHDSDIPGMFGIDVVLGFMPGSNTFHIKAGDAILDVTITGR